MPEDNSVMHIGEVAERVGLSLRTLRHYDEIGLVVASGRSEGGFREYTDADVDRLLLVRRMKPLGFSLEAMIELLAIIDELSTTNVDSSASLRARLDHFIVDAEDRRERLRTQVAMADEFIGLLRRR